MLTIQTWPAGSGGRGIRRRDVLSVGTLALGGLTLADGMRGRAAASPSDGATSFVRPNKSVVVLFLAGGPSQYETFDPKPDGFDSHTSIAGHLATKLPGVRFASYFPEMAARADRLTIVRSMVAKTANHAKAAKNLLTGGFEDPNGREGAQATFPSMGAAYAHARGATDPLTGMPSYATVPPVFDRVDGLKISSVNPGVESVTLGSGGGTLGAAFAPFNPESSSGWTEALSPQLPEIRLDARRDLLNELDTLNRRFETHPAFHDLDAVNQQAYEALRGGAIRAALDLGREEPRVAAMYDTSRYPIYGWNKGNFWEKEGPRSGMPLGRQLLLARRLIEAGCRFVTVTHRAAGGDEVRPADRRGSLMATKLTKSERTLFVDDGARRGPMTIVRLKFHPTQPYLFAQVVDRRLAVWDLTAEPQKLKKGVVVVGELVCAHAVGWVRGFDVHPDGGSLVTAGSDRRLKRWRWADGKPADAPDVDVAAHDGWVEAVAFSPDGRQVATCGADRQVKLWDADDFSSLKTLSGHRGYVRDVAYRPDGRRLVSAGEDGAVIVRDATTGEIVRTIDFGDANDQQGQTPAVPGAHRLAVSADGRWLAVAGGQKTVVYDLDTGVPVVSDKLRLQVAFHPSAPLLAAGEDTLKVWDCEVDAWKPPAVDGKGKSSSPGPVVGRELASIKRGEYSHGIAFSPDGLRMAVGRSDGTVELWDVEP